jgi:hypothetical protein
MVCQGECFTKIVEDEVYSSTHMHNMLALQIKFKTFYNQIGWRLGGRLKSKSELDVPKGEIQIAAE